jgi:hypothetical protein
MTKSAVVRKKKPRPPQTGNGVQVGERWQLRELAATDAWIVAQDENFTRGQAIRRLVEIGLSEEIGASCG